MKKVLLIIAILLLSIPAYAEERAIYIDGTWASTPSDALNVLVRLKNIGINHAIITIGNTPKESVDLFLSGAKATNIRVSVVLAVTDGTDSVFRPDYPEMIAAKAADMARKAVQPDKSVRPI